MAFRSLASILAICGGFSPFAAGCEQHVDEPVQPDRAQRAEAQQVLATESPSKEAQSKLAACMKPLEGTPTRMVTGAVPNPDCPADDLASPPILPRGKVEFFAQDQKIVVPVEIAQEDAHRTRGLMFRKSLPEAEGMLFVFEHSKELSFWMHNTCIPLDMIFASADGTIVAIQENTPTLSDENFSSGCNARYVIEMNAGWARKNGIQAGMRVKLPR